MKLSIGTLLFALSLNAFAHREHLPGPNGGQIRMPGAFHTELVIDGEIAKIYLLDMAFKNPTTEESKVSMRLTSDELSAQVDCQEKADYFECKLPTAINGFKQIALKASRKGAQGKEVTYPLQKKFAFREHSFHH